MSVKLKNPDPQGGLGGWMLVKIRDCCLLDQELLPSQLSR
jgi:hypothetical protein